MEKQEETFEEAIAREKERTGAEVEMMREPGRMTALYPDNIRRFSWAIGDDNPLWNDPEYGKKTGWGCMIAHPLMVCCFENPRWGLIGFRGWQGLHTGNIMEWYLPLRVNDVITTKMFIGDIQEKETRFAGRAALQFMDQYLYNQDNQLVAKVTCHQMRTRRAEGGERRKEREKKGEVAPPPKYTKEQIEEIMNAYMQEERRGANPRYWEDVQVGEEISGVVKGPLTVTDIVCFHMAWPGIFLRPHRLWYKYLKDHPAAGVLDAMGIPDNPERAHWDDEYARSIGSPRAYDYAWQRFSWIGHMLTNWMGDDGFLKTMDVQVRALNPIGNTCWCSGKITDKIVQDGEHIVKCEVVAESQEKQVLCKGTATVTLPSKAKP